MIVPGISDFSVGNGDMITEPCDTSLPGSHLLAPCVVRCNAGSKLIGVEVQNTSGKQVTIPDNVPICTLHPAPNMYGHTSGK